MRVDYSIGELLPYVNWLYFYHAFGTAHMPEDGRRRLRAEAEDRLRVCADRYRAHALFLLPAAYSEGDDIVVLTAGGDGQGASRDRQGVRIPCLRQQQQGSGYLCLADFISRQDDPQRPPLTPQEDLVTRRIGIFATTVDAGLETDFDADPYEKLMMQLLADRLAEAAAERLHEAVRRQYWGYAPDEQLAMADLLAGRYQGIRPAVGYPSLPDTSLNFVIDRLADLRQIGIRLTESGAMKPHASVSGLMLGHPKARYFSVGTIGDDQLADYARRREVPVVLMRRYLGGNIP